MKRIVQLMILFLMSGIWAVFQGKVFWAGEITAPGVEVKDMAGRDVIINRDGEILASSDIVFYFKDPVIPEEAVSENKCESDWIFCECEEEKGRMLLSPVKNNVFRLNLNGDKEIRFFWIDRVSREIREDRGLPESFKIRYEADPDILPEAELFTDEEYIGDQVFFRGGKPKLTVRGNEFAHVYIRIKSGEEERITESTGEKTVEFEEGEYETEVWGEDGWGVKYKAELKYEHFIYDNSKPGSPKILIGALKEGYAGSEGYIYGDPVVIRAEAEDRISGTDHYIFRIVNRINGGEYEAEGDRLQVNPPFSGKIIVTAVDRAGNRSDEAVIDNLTIDNEKPVLNEYRTEKAGDREIGIVFGIYDSLSGIKNEKVYINDRLFKSKSMEGGKEDILRVVLDERELITGKNMIRLECSDMMLNTAVYEFTMEKTDERKNEEDAEDEPPELFLKGFKDFEKSEGPVNIETGILNGYDDGGIVIIEQHDEDGNLKCVYKAESGYLRISEEGNYVIRYIVSRGDTDYEKTGYFTIDNSAPCITGLDSINGKSFHSVSFRNSLLTDIRDYTYVDSRLTLSGRNYNGEKISEPGRYVLKLSATDELGHSSEETAEFLILKDENKHTAVKDTEISLPVNKDPEGKVSVNGIIVNSVSDNKVSVNSISAEGIRREIISGNEIRLSKMDPGAKEVTLKRYDRFFMVLALMIIFIPISSSVLYLMKEPGEE